MNAGRIRLRGGGRGSHGQSADQRSVLRFLALGAAGLAGMLWPGMASIAAVHSAATADVRAGGRGSDARVAPAEAGGAEADPGSVLVRFKAGVSDVEIDAALKRAGVTSTAITYRLVPGLMAVNVAMGTAKDAIAALTLEPSVMYAEPDFIRAALAQETPYGVTNVNAPLVWALGGNNNRGDGVRVAVLDTGGCAHEDLPFPDFFETFVPGELWLDLRSHGTHCAGTVCALDNDQGVIGVAPNISLMVGKVLGNDGFGNNSWVVAGVDWAVTNGAKVISMSLGGGGASQAEQDLYTAAFNGGALIIAAGGNGGPEALPQYPAAYSNVIAVQAVDQTNAVASFGQRGSYLDISAPGVDVKSTTPVVSPTIFWSGAQSATTASWAIGSRRTYSFGTIVHCPVDQNGYVFPSSLAGKIALIRNYTPTTSTGTVVNYTDVIISAAAAGPAGIIIADTFGGSARQLFPILLRDVPFPVVSITQADGDVLEAATPVQGQTGTDTIVGFGYAFKSGTSMATPHVSGVAALLYGKYADRNPTPAQVQRALIESATDAGDPGRDDTYGAGLVNASAAITRLGQILCPADFNSVNSVSVQDIFDYLSAWFASDPRADFNSVNGVTVQDIFDFLAAWFQGC